MRTKVTTNSAGEDPCLAHRRAAVLKLLFAGQRGRGVTLQSVADKVGTQRSNLSAYIGSRGQRRCIAFERLREALHLLGAHWDFTLRGRFFHRWDLGQDPELVSGLDAILAANRVVRARVIVTTGCVEAFVCFVALEADGEAVGLLRVQQPIFDAVCASFGYASDQPVADALLSDAVQSAWLAKDPIEAMAAVRELLMGGSVPIGNDMATEGRLVAAG